MTVDVCVGVIVGVGVVWSIKLICTKSLTKFTLVSWSLKLTPVIATKNDSTKLSNVLSCMPVMSID